MPPVFQALPCSDLGMTSEGMTRDAGDVTGGWLGHPLPRPHPSRLGGFHSLLTALPASMLGPSKMKSQINVPLCSKQSAASASHKIKPIALPAAHKPFGRCCRSGFVSHQPVTPWPQKPVLSPTLSSACHFLAPASPTLGPAVSNHLPRSYSGHFLAQKFSLLERHLETHSKV